MAKANKNANPIILKQGMSIGSGNAESDDEFLFDCFVQYPPVEQCIRIQSPGMIIAGRTGAGKTAIIRYIERTAEHAVEIDPSEMSMSYVSNSDALRFLQAIGADLDLLFQVLWKHVLCIEFIRLRWKVDNEYKSRTVFDRLISRFIDDQRKSRPIKYLKEWEGKFWITMDQNIKEITESVENKLGAEFGADIARFKAGGQYAKRLSAEKKSELVARSRNIINAEQLMELSGVIDMLAVNSAADQMPKFYLLIDKLDEGWVDESIRFRLIRALIASLKSFRHITNLKILVALRADILERVVQETHDITFQREKFEDYFVRLKWPRSALKELVDKRIAELFRRQYTAERILFDDLFTARIGSRDNAFDYMVDRTLMRPRDMIAFVNECLSVADGKSEISATHIRQAEGEFSRKRRDALAQEWRSAFPSVSKLFTFLSSRRIVTGSIEDYATAAAMDDLALNILSDAKTGHDPIYDCAQQYVDGKTGALLDMAKAAVAVLYRIGAVGVKHDADGRFHYSYLDAPIITGDLLSMDTRVRIHPMLHAAFGLQEKGSRSASS